MTKPSWQPRYSQAEVRALIEGYAALKEVRTTSGFGLYLLCVYADLDRALCRLPQREYKTVLLHGLLNLRDAETYLGVDRRTVWRWYSTAIGSLTNYLNGGSASTE